MLVFIITDILMLAIGAILYLMVRALPRVVEDAGDRQSIVDRLAHSEIPEKLDAAFDAVLVKFLRKTKVFLLKLENSLNRRLRKINLEASADAATKASIVDFGDFANSHAEEVRELQEVK